MERHSWEFLLDAIDAERRKEKGRPTEKRDPMLLLQLEALGGLVHERLHGQKTWGDGMTPKDINAPDFVVMPSQLYDKTLDEVRAENTKLTQELSLARASSTSKGTMLDDIQKELYGVQCELKSVKDANRTIDAARKKALRLPEQQRQELVALRSRYENTHTELRELKGEHEKAWRDRDKAYDEIEVLKKRVDAAGITDLVELGVIHLPGACPFTLYAHMPKKEGT